MNQLTEDILIKVITQRPENSHKGTFGRAVLIGGNNQYGGAIIMSAEACINTGAGLTTVVTAEKNHAPCMLDCQKQWSLIFLIRSCWWSC